jgi:hypothetical protein
VVFLTKLSLSALRAEDELLVRTVVDPVGGSSFRLSGKPDLPAFLALRETGDVFSAHGVIFPRKYVREEKGRPGPPFLVPIVQLRSPYGVATVL